MWWYVHIRNKHPVKRSGVIFLDTMNFLPTLSSLRYVVQNECNSKISIHFHFFLITKKKQTIFDVKKFNILYLTENEIQKF